MSKLSKAFRALKLLTREPWLLNRILDEDRQWQKRINGKYGLSNGFPVVRPEALVGDLNESVYPYASLDGSSLPADLALLKKLARSIDNCRYFEIGTWRGESVANVAAVAKECYTLNLSPAQMDALGLDKKYIGLHGFFSRDLPNVTHLEGDSREFDYASIGKKMDLIFIDGDHHYELVKNDTEKVFEPLAHEDSIIVWHDYAYNPERLRYEVMAGILDGSPSHAHPHIYHVANTMCAIYWKKPVASAPFTSPQQPEGAFELELRWKANS